VLQSTDVGRAAAEPTLGVEVVGAADDRAARVKKINSPTIAADNAGHVALTFPGTMTGDRNDNARRWGSWVVVSTNALDASPLFVANIGNAVADPVHHGGGLARVPACFSPAREALLTRRARRAFGPAPPPS
jgi:hypothetical protein